MIGDKVYGKVTPAQIKDILDEYRQEDAKEEGAE